MRVCDRHPRKPATDSVTLEKTDSRFDLCEECVDELSSYLNSKDAEIKKPRKKDSA